MDTVTKLPNPYGATRRDMEKAAEVYANITENCSDPFAYSRAMSHMRAGRHHAADYAEAGKRP